MDERRELDYDPQFLSIRPQYLQTVDSILSRVWERMRDIFPDHGRETYSRNELRSSRLGQALLTIADYVDRGPVAAEKVQLAMKQVCRMLYGDPQGEGYRLPADFHKTPLGQLYQEAYIRLYDPEDLLTPVQAYRLLGIARQTLYDRSGRGKLTIIVLDGENRFLRSEIEEWKRRRESHQSTPVHEE